jgi:hypothetical protein
LQRIILTLAAEQGKDVGALAIIGDKKPVQQSAPELMTFTLSHWPTARFLHIPRHPTAVVNSMMDKVATQNPNMHKWRGNTQELIEFWVRNEQRVIDLKAARTIPILTVPFHLLVTEADVCWQRILEFLELPYMPNRILASGVLNPDAAYKDRPVALSAAARKIVKFYGLQLLTE